MKSKRRSLYTDIGLNEKSFPFSIRLREAKRAFWIAFILWICWCFAIGRFVYMLIPFRMKGLVEPPLSGSAQFAVLAIVVALSVYLRQVYANALDLRDKIRGGLVWNFPPSEPHSKEKMEALDSMAEKLAFAGPFLIWLFLPVSSRIVLDVVFRFSFKQSSDVLFALDFVIGQWFFFAFVGLAIAHYISTSHNDRLRIAARFREDALLPLPKKSQAANNQSSI